MHLWANRATGGRDIRNSGGNVFTRDNGATLCSYGAHWVIAAFITHAKTGDTMLLWNRDSCSNTTARHTSQAWRALPRHLESARVPVPRISWGDLQDLPGIAADLITAAVKSLDKSQRARSNRPYLIRAARGDFANAARILTFAGDAKKAARIPVIPAEPTKDQITGIIRALAADEYRAKAREQIARARERMGAAQNPPEWQAGAAHRIESAKMGIQNADAAAGYYKRAGLKPAPECARITKTLRALIAALEPVAKRERDESNRRNLRDAAPSVYRFLRAHIRPRRRLPFGATYSARERSNAWEWEQITRNIGREEFPAEWRALDRRYNATLKIRALRDVCHADYSPREISRAYENAREYFDNARSAGYWIDRARRAIADANARIAAENAREIELNRERVAQWRAGERVSIPHSVPTMARIVGDTVETSRGARVPFDHAARLVRIAQRIAQRGGQEWAPGAGPRVGHYQVTRIGADLSAVIGCHEFTPEESARIVAEIVAHPAFNATHEETTA